MLGLFYMYFVVCRLLSFNKQFPNFEYFQEVLKIGLRSVPTFDGREIVGNGYKMYLRERSGSVVDCLTRNRGAAGSSLTGVTALWSLSKNINPSLVLVQPRKTRPFITERLLMGRKESNQTHKTKSIFR